MGIGYKGVRTSKSKIKILFVVFFFQAEDGIRDRLVTGVQTCALPIYLIREQARAEAYESMQKNSQPQTIQDLDASGLSNFIAKAEDDPELEQHLPEARLELQDRKSVV